MENQGFKKVKHILWVILLANFTVAFVKIFTGYAINSSSLVADGFHSLTDGSSNIIGLIGISVAAKPVDENHPYGHKKFETITGLFIAGMLVFLGVTVFLGAIKNFLHPVIPVVTMESLVALAATLSINIFVAKYEYKQGKKLHSDILVSDSLHTRSDIYISIGVLLTLIGIKLGLPPVIDPVISLVVGGFIFHAAWEIFEPIFGVLSDKAAIDKELIKEIVDTFDQVKDVHNIRSRGRDDDIHLDFHIMISPDMTVEDSHDLMHSIEDKIRAATGKQIHTIIHIEPFK